MPQHRITDQLAAAGPSPPARRETLRGERSVLPAGRVQVAAQLPADRRWATTQLGGDHPHREPATMQVADPDPLVLGQVPRRDLRLRHARHWRIVQPPATAAGHCAPVSPTFSRPPVHPDGPARLSIRDTLSDQPREPLPLRRLRRRTRPTTTHHNSRLPQALQRSLETARLALAPPVAGNCVGRPLGLMSRCGVAGFVDSRTDAHEALLCGLS
jgi:hypothetical protein